MRVFPPTKEGIFPPMEGIPPMEGSANTVADPQNVMLFSCFWRRGFAAKCTMFRNYNSHISLIFTNICNFSFCKSRRCAPWQWAGDEALGVQRSQRRAKWLGARTGCLLTVITVSLPLNIVPFPGLKTLLATLMHAYIPQNGLPCCCSGCSRLIKRKKDIVLSPVPCQKLHHRHTWKQLLTRSSTDRVAKRRFL